MANKKWKVHFIPQTHWDKEWYFTKYVSDVFLIDNIDKIYEIYKRDETEFKSFVYDGQYSIIDDYLSYFPENEYKIKELVSAGKLIIGPWYTQTDTTNAMGESIVRNLLIGTKSTEKYGNTMHVGYIPDSFGFNANIPQILKKSELKALVHWRGIHSEHIKDGVFNMWKGLDGTEIPIYNLYKWGYGVGVGAGFERYKEKWTIDDMKIQAKIYLDNSKEKQLPILKSVSQNTNGLVLMPMGSDQLPIYDGIRQWVEELNKQDDEHEWVMSNYDEFIDELLIINDTNELHRIEGELRFGQYSRVHKTITSSRYDIKKLARDLEYMIYEQTEPLGIMFEKLGGIYPANLIEKNLKKLLESQAHDSLGGCNTDETNETIVERLNAGLHSLESLNTLMKRRISEAANIDWNEFMLYNLKPYSKKISEKIWIFTNKPSFKITNSKAANLGFSIIDQKHVNIEKFVMFDHTHLEDTEFSIDEKGQFWTQISINVELMEGMSYKTFKVIEEDKKFNIKLSNNNKIENNLFKLEVNKFGQISLFDKNKNLTIDNAFSLESDFDAGDSYDFSPSKLNPGKNNELISFECNEEKNGQINSLNIKYLFSVPKALESKEMINQMIQLKILLIEERIEFSFDVQSIADDIRWRLICDTKIPSSNSYADTSFGTIERPVSLTREMAVWKEQKWSDCPIEIEAIESVVYLKNEQDNYNVFTKGNNEYQIIGEDYSKIAVTLFRGYSTIGRRYMEYRPGRASGIDSYPHPTMGANLHEKNLNIDLAVVMNITNSRVREAKEWAAASVYYQRQEVNPFHWKGDTFVMAKKPLPEAQKELSAINLKLPDDIVVSAFKKSHDGTGYIIRIYNAGEKKINFNKPANFKEVNLMENNLSSLNDILDVNEVKTYYIDQL